MAQFFLNLFFSGLATFILFGIGFILLTILWWVLEKSDRMAGAVVFVITWLYLFAVIQFN